MKIITTPYQPEIAEYRCDKHPDRTCANEITTSSWYGSKYDLRKLQLHLCDECMEEFLSMIVKNYPVKLEEEPMFGH